MPLPKWVSPQELLSYAALLHGLNDVRKTVDSSLETWDCASFRLKPLAACSYGMQKRVGLALATIHKPALLILDEPFSGLDLYHIHTLEKALSERQKEGKTTVLSTHILPYVVSACNRVWILASGRLSELSDWTKMSSSDKMNSIERQFF